MAPVGSSGCTGGFRLRFAASTGPGQGYEASRFHQSQDFFQLAVASDESGELGRQIVRQVGVVK
jgi:hypothetical protein